ncbi:EpsI family protein [Paucibacter sp. DJ1R-11]|uniref:exosortase-associated protein EpsI, B-type n=1 Tax=Paucibacter sp. DJ1R-11 TaxID=2893556 RepID=UPI0021E5029F|nr:exosortase-associated protein EpsI, B-type [Paucibacter sp. DJ1R-11]MCV2365063.1 EpsI family protein [Paucibacter sp. DJ1R-11]
MHFNRTAAIVMTVLMLASAGAAHRMTPRVHLTDQIGKPDLETLFPKAFGAWRLDTSMPVILPAPDVQARLDKIYNQVLSRSYINAQGQRIMLSVAYGGDQSDGTRVHRPEVCYPSQGFQILSNQAAELPVAGKDLHVRRLTAKLSQRMEPITYWVVVGDQAVRSATEQKVAQLAYGVRGVIPDGLLVRVSSIDANSEAAFAVQQQYLTDLAGALQPAARARVFGR